MGYRARKDPTRTYDRHGLTAAKTALSTFGARAIDGRTAFGRALAGWRRDLINDLGGAPAVSTQQRALVDVAVRTWLLLSGVDTWLLQQDSLINRKRRSLIPALRERSTLVNTLVGTLRELGIERRAAPAPDLRAYITARSAEVPSPSSEPITIEPDNLPPAIAGSITS